MELTFITTALGVVLWLHGYTTKWCLHSVKTTFGGGTHYICVAFLYYTQYIPVKHWQMQRGTANTSRDNNLIFEIRSQEHWRRYRTLSVWSQKEKFSFMGCNFSLEFTKDGGWPQKYQSSYEHCSKKFKLSAPATRAKILPKG